MSETTSISIGKRVQNLEASPQFSGYSGVEIIVDEDTSYFAGDTTGRVLTIENPWGTQAIANNIIAAIRGFQYQPMKADKALINPAAEIGDGVNISGLYSGIYKMSKDFSPLMTANIEAPQDEEIDHEYPYEAKADRVYKRSIAENKAQIKVASNAITAEVTRATGAESSLSSRITANANSITAEVSARTALGNRVTTAESKITQQATQISAKVSQTGGANSSFGWSLKSDAFRLYSGGTEVMTVNSSGMTVKGQIKADTGYIGGSSGFTIKSGKLYSGSHSAYSSTNSGVYVGTDGISLGANFRVSSSGAVTATSGTFTSITLNGVTLSGNVNAAGGTFNGGNYTNASLQGGFNGAANISGGSLAGGVGFGGSGWTVNSTIATIGDINNRVAAIYADYINTNNLASKISSLSSLYVNNLILSSGAFYMGGRRVSLGYIKNGDGAYSYVLTWA